MSEKWNGKPSNPEKDSYHLLRVKHLDWWQLRGAHWSAKEQVWLFGFGHADAENTAKFYDYHREIAVPKELEEPVE